jgi:hypothetical protein
MPGGDPGDLAGPVPVDGEQHGTEYDAVVRVELAADCGDQLVTRPGRVLVSPGHDGGAGPGQVRGVVVPEPHGRLHELLLTPAVRSMADASSPSRANVVNGSVPRGEHAGKGS